MFLNRIIVESFSPWQKKYIVEQQLQKWMSYESNKILQGY